MKKIFKFLILLLVFLSFSLVIFSCGNEENENKDYVSVSFNLNGGKLDVGYNTFTYKIGESFTVPVPTKEGMDFDGWYYKGEKYVFPEVWNINDKYVTFDAKWKYTLTFREDGFEDVSFTLFEGEYLNIKNVPVIKTVKRESYFHWSVLDFSELNLNTVITLRETPKPFFTLTFKQKNTDDVNIKVYEDEVLDKSQIPQLLSVSGYDVSWDVADLNLIKNDKTINAVYTPKTYKIYYSNIEGVKNLNEISFDGENYYQEVTFNASYNLFAPQKEGFEFLYWTYNDNPKISGANWDIANDVMLKAVWGEGISVSFICDGQLVKTILLLSGEDVEESDIPLPIEKDGYDTYWNKTANELKNITESLVVYLVEIPKTYTIIYNIPQFSYTFSGSITYGEHYVLDFPDLSKFGNNFKFSCWLYKGETMSLSGEKWNIIGDENDKIELTAKIMVGHLFKYIETGKADEYVYKELGLPLEESDYPKFEKIHGKNVSWLYAQNYGYYVEYITSHKYTICFDSNGGENTGNKEQYFGLPYELPNISHPSGYHVVWCYNGEEVPIKGDKWSIYNEETNTIINLTAKWQYNVTYKYADGSIYKTLKYDVNTYPSNIEVYVKEGYNVSWEDNYQTVLNSMNKDMEVKATENVKTFRVYYVLNYGKTLSDTSGLSYDSERKLYYQNITFGQKYKIKSAPKYDEDGVPAEQANWYYYWVYDNHIIAKSGVWKYDSNIDFIDLILMKGKSEF